MAVSQSKSGQRKPGWWYPYIFVGAFVVVVGVNLALAYFATSTFTGLQTEKPYEKGLAYNQTLEQARRQDEMGWRVDVAVDPVRPGNGHQALVAVKYLDRDGRPVQGMEVKARLVRPTAKGYDFDAALAEVAPGTYGATLDLPLDGVWDMALAASGGGDVTHQLNRRFVLK